MIGDSSRFWSVTVNKPRDLPAAAQTERVPYQLPQPRDMRPDQVVMPALPPAGDKLWVQLSDISWVRPLQFNVTLGQYTHMMRVTKPGAIARHRHSGGVHAYVIKGRWHYLEHDWVAEEGSYIFEPPGETHTLVVPDDCTEMITLFQVNGSLIYVDPHGTTTGYDDVFTRLEKARAHYASVGLGADYVDQFIR
jgi:2,4'-dihydroxyacetophenone dioxygenase